MGSPTFNIAELVSQDQVIVGFLFADHTRKLEVLEGVKEKFVPNLYLLEMEHFIISEELDRRLFSHNLTGEIVHKIVNNVIMDLTDRKWDKLINGQSNEGMRRIAQDIEHVIGHFCNFTHLVDDINYDEGRIRVKELLLHPLVHNLARLIMILGFYFLQEYAIII